MSLQDHHDEESFVPPPHGNTLLVFQSQSFRESDSRLFVPALSLVDESARFRIERYLENGVVQAPEEETGEEEDSSAASRLCRQVLRSFSESPLPRGFWRGVSVSAFSWRTPKSYHTHEYYLHVEAVNAKKETIEHLFRCLLDPSRWCQESGGLPYLRIYWGGHNAAVWNRPEPGVSFDASQVQNAWLVNDEKETLCFADCLRDVIEPHCFSRSRIRDIVDFADEDYKGVVLTHVAENPGVPVQCEHGLMDVVQVGCRTLPEYFLVCEQQVKIRSLLVGTSFDAFEGSLRRTLNRLHSSEKANQYCERILQQIRSQPELIARKVLKPADLIHHLPGPRGVSRGGGGVPAVAVHRIGVNAGYLHDRPAIAHFLDSELAVLLVGITWGDCRFVKIGNVIILFDCGNRTVNSLLASVFVSWSTLLLAYPIAGYQFLTMISSKDQDHHRGICHLASVFDSHVIGDYPNQGVYQLLNAFLGEQRVFIGSANPADFRARLINQGEEYGLFERGFDGDHSRQIMIPADHHAGTATLTQLLGWSGQGGAGTAFPTGGEVNGGTVRILNLRPPDTMSENNKSLVLIVENFFLIGADCSAKRLLQGLQGQEGGLTGFFRLAADVDRWKLVHVPHHGSGVMGSLQKNTPFRWDFFRKFPSTHYVFTRNCNAKNQGTAYRALCSHNAAQATVYSAYRDLRTMKADNLTTVVQTTHHLALPEIPTTDDPFADFDKRLVEFVSGINVNAPTIVPFGGKVVSHRV